MHFVLVSLSVTSNGFRLPMPPGSMPSMSLALSLSELVSVDDSAAGPALLLVQTVYETRHIPLTAFGEISRLFFSRYYSLAYTVH